MSRSLEIGCKRFHNPQPVSAAKAGIDCREENITPEEFVRADECFITGTTKGIMPAGKIEEISLSPVPGPITARLMDAYRSFVRERYY